MIIEDYQEKLNYLKGQQQKLQSQLEVKKSNLKEEEKELKNIKEAQEIIQIVAKLTQNQIKIHITDIVNLALQSIPFTEGYEFGLDFVVKRNKTECELYFLRSGNKIYPMDSSGGGVIDIASFGLRIALWSLKLGKKNNTIILDEPFKFLSKELRPYASQMLQEISKRLNIQFIIVTHDEEFINAADKVFKVILKKGVSKVEEEC